MSKSPRGAREDGATSAASSTRGQNNELGDGSSDLPEPWMYAVTITIAAAAGILIFWVQW